MKLAYGSDIHLEFGTRDFEIPKVDFLLLAGDIYTPWKNDYNSTVKKFFKDIADKVPQTYMIMGNHEHYHGNFYNTKDLIKKDLPSNITLLDNEYVELDSQTILFGSTFWTDYKCGDPMVIWDAQNKMNDHHLVYSSESTPYGGRVKFLPSHAIEENIQARIELKKCLALGKDTIVMTHHAPTFDSVIQKYKGDTLSFAYANTGIEEMNLDNVFVWIHGHMHTKMDRMMPNGKTPILCNPRGYKGYEQIEKSFKFEEFSIE